MGESRARRGPSRCELLTNEGLRLGGPGHDLRIKERPGGGMALPEPDLSHCGAHAGQDGLCRGAVLKEGPASPRVDHSGLAAGHAKAVPCCIHVSANDQQRPGAHMLLFDDDLAYALFAIVGERLVRMLEYSFVESGRRRRHRRRQVDQPFWMDRKPRHHLEGGRSAALIDGDGAAGTDLNNALAQHKPEVEHIIARLLKAETLW